MPTIDERVAELEARMIPDIRTEMRLGFDRLEKRFDQIDKRFEQVEYRLERLEGRVERLDDKVDRHFMWVVGIQFTTMLIFIAALAAAVLRAVRHPQATRHALRREPGVCFVERSLQSRSRLPVAPEREQPEIKSGVLPLRSDAPPAIAASAPSGATCR